MKRMLAALSAVTLLTGTALAQTSPPHVVIQPMQSGAVTGGTSSAVTPRLNADKNETDKKDGTATSRDQTTGEKEAPKPNQTPDKK